MTSVLKIREHVGKALYEEWFIIHGIKKLLGINTWEDIDPDSKEMWCKLADAAILEYASQIIKKED